MAIDNNVSDHELEEIVDLLKKLNKPYVKSIQSPDESIIDCVPLHRQPAFDNPFFNNHTIQMRPSSYPIEHSRNSSSNQSPLTQPWLAIGRCPEGTTPIRRTTKEDILRVKSIRRCRRKKAPRTPHPNSSPAGQTDDDDGHKYEIRAVQEGKYYGASADLTVWNTRVKAGEFSLAQIWVSAGDDDVDLNTVGVEAGW